MFDFKCSCFWWERTDSDIPFSVSVDEESIFLTVAYLGFHKGLANFSLATSAYTKEAKLFFTVAKTDFFLAKGPWPNGAMAPWAQGAIALNMPLLFVFYLAGQWRNNCYEVQCFSNFENFFQFISNKRWKQIRCVKKNMTLFIVPSTQLLPHKFATCTSFPSPELHFAEHPCWRSPKET